MPLNLQGFVGDTNQWAGLYHAADQLEKRQLKADQLAANQLAKRNAAGTFLQNYLNPKDYLSGTQLDPLINEGIQEAMQRGSALAAYGADSPTLMMALGPMVNKLSMYSTNAKTINKQIDDQIKLMKDTGHIGYDYGKLRDEALRNAFYKQGANGQMQLDPDQADPSVDWVGKAIEASPEKVTTDLGWDTFARDAKMKSESASVQDFDRFGNMDKHNVNMKFQEYMVPEWEGDAVKGMKVKGFVPKYNEMIDGGQSLMHPFTDDKGNVTMAPVRILDESVYKGLPEGLRKNLRGKLKQHIKEYETNTGEKIALDSPRAEYIERALAYDELNRPQRNRGNKGDLEINDKPSQQMISLNVKSTPQALETARAYKEMEADVRDNHRQLKQNPVETLGEIYNGNPDYLTKSLEAIPNGGGRTGIEVTDAFPGGTLKSAKSDGFNYKKIYFDPVKRDLVLERETKQDMFGRKHQSLEIIPEKEMGQFMYRIGRINKMSYDQIKKLMAKMGFKDNKFKNSEQQRAAADVDRRVKADKGWRQVLNTPFTLFNQNTTPNQ